MAASTAREMRRLNAVQKSGERQWNRQLAIGSTATGPCTEWKWLISCRRGFFHLPGELRTGGGLPHEPFDERSARKCGVNPAHTATFELSSSRP